MNVALAKVIDLCRTAVKGEEIRILLSGEEYLQLKEMTEEDVGTPMYGEFVRKGINIPQTPEEVMGFMNNMGFIGISWGMEE